jgi:hypothetical protein
MEVCVAGTGSYPAEIVEWARAAGATVVGLVELLDPGRVGMVKHGVPVCDLDDVPADGTVAIGLGGDRRAVLYELLHRFRAERAARSADFVTASVASRRMR